LMKRNFGNRNVTLTAIEEIKESMEELGAFRYCKRKIAEYMEKSHSSLKIVRDSKFKDYLMRFSDCVHEFEG